MRRVREWFENWSGRRESITYLQAGTGEKVTVPLHPDLAAHLGTLTGTDKPEVFITPPLAGLKPGGWHGLSESFKRIMRKAGLDVETVKSAGARQLSRRTFHALRHGYTNALAKQGVAPEMRMKLAGHKTEAIHRGYTHHELEKLRAAVENSVAEFKVRKLPDSRVDLSYVDPPFNSDRNYEGPSRTGQLWGETRENFSG